MSLLTTHNADFDIYVDAQVLSTLSPTDRATVVSFLGGGLFTDLYNANNLLIQVSVDQNGPGVFVDISDSGILASIIAGDIATLLTNSTSATFYPALGAPAYSPNQANAGVNILNGGPAYLAIADRKLLEDRANTPTEIPIKYTVNGLNPDFENGTYLKIGPHVYGGEVQSVRILEDKAIESFKGARSNADFLVDAGTGDADIEIVLMFRDNEAIADSFRPLVALFRMCPITSIRNKVINAALQNDFINDKADGVQTLALKKFKQAIEKDFRRAQHGKLILAYNNQFPSSVVGADGTVTQALFDFFQKHAPGNAIFNTWPTYEDFLSHKSEIFDIGLDIHQANEDLGKIESDNSTQRIRTLPRKDTTGHVPVAFVSMEAQTHPELPEALIVKLLFKRIHIDNYLRDGLQYRTINNTPTGDPRNAYWLRRALDIYIDSHLDVEWIFRNVLNESKGDVVLRYGGDDIVLKLFKEEYDLHGLTLNHADNRAADHPNGTILSQMSFSIANKFAFIRLQGKSYPTVQFMGSESGRIMMTIRTNDEAKFEAIHGYKSAADFFVRTEDRLDRFNGWHIDSWLTRLFNTIDLPEIHNTYGENIENANDESRFVTENENRYPRSSWYPTKIVSATNDESPGLRDISIVFAETNPDFFSDFGFTVQRKGYSLESFTEFFGILYDRAMKFREILAANGYLAAVNNPNNELNLDLYAFNLFFGDNSPENKFSIINPDTIVACFLELTRYDLARGNAENVPEDSVVSLAQRIINELTNDSIFSGTIDNPANLLDLLQQDISNIAGVALHIATFGLLGDDVALSKDLAKDLAAFYFSGSTDSILVARIQNLPEHQDELYQYIWEHSNIVLGENFKQALLSTLISRRDPILGDRIYDLQGIINAYNSITLAVEAKGTSLFEEDLVDSLIKGARDEKKIFISGDGYKSKTTIATSYPDFPFITYGELFTLPGVEDNWFQYLPTFQDIGIMNPDVSFHSNRGGFTSHSVTTAQTKPKVGDADSPIPPSVFFYSESELSEIRDNLDKESAEWFTHLSELRLDLPFDIERLLIDKHGRATGIRSNITGATGTTLPTRIERMIESARFSNKQRFNDAAADILLQQAKTYVAQTPGLELDDIASPGQDRRDFLQEVLDMIRGDGPLNTKLSGSNLSVPLLMGTHIKSDIVRWVPLTGLFGDNIKRGVLREATRAGLDIDHMLDTGLTRAASGHVGGPVITAGNNADEARVSMLKVTQAIADNSNNMIKAFPVMRLYLLDFVGPRIVAQDNFYGYHAISSIDITLDKNDADLAVIRLADPFHVLQGRAFNNEFKKSKNRIADVIIPATLDDVKARDTLKRIALIQGRPIQIRGGYASEPDNLDVLFTGRISEIQFGDVVTIVAQSWKAELISRSVEMELKSQDNSSVKDLVVETVRRANPAGMGKEYSQREAQQLFELAGSITAGSAIFNAFARGNNSPGGPTSSTSRGTHGFNPFGFGIFRQYGQGLDMRLKNVWVPDTERSRWDFFAEMSETGWQSTGWAVPMTSAWEVLQNCTNYLWGYISQVVPYDGEATLFFGKPEQMYFYTNGGGLANKRASESKAVAISAIKDAFTNIIEDFITSLHYDRHVVNTLLKKEIKLVDFPNGNVNYLGGETRYSVKQPGGAFSTFNSSLTSLLTHRYIFDYWKNSSFTDFDGLVGATKVQPGKTSPLAFNKFMLGRSFVDQFDSIVEILGDPKKAALLLVGKFYGLNYEAISDQLVSSVLVGEMLKKDPRTEQLKKTFAEILRSKDNIRDVVDKFIPDVKLSLEQAEAMLSVTGDQNAIRELFRGLHASGTVTQTSKHRFGFSSTRFTTGSRKLITVKIDSALTSPFWEELLAVIKLFLDELPGSGDAYFSGPSTEGGTLSYEIFEKNKSENVNLRAFTNALAGLSTNSSLQYAAQTITEDNFDQAITLINSVLVNTIAKLKEIKSLSIRNKLIFESDELSILERLGVDLDEFNNIEDYMIEYLPIFRSFVYFFSEYLVGLQSPQGSGEVEVADAIALLKGSTSFDFLNTMNMKVFRDYHYIRNGVDIIANNLAATTREMHNTVVVRHPKQLETTNNTWYEFLPGAGQGDFDSIQISAETEWTTWPSPTTEGHIGLQFNPDVNLQDKKIIVYTDLNATSREQAARIATNVLAKSMRPMYRNNIHIMGRPIKPWDHIYLDDKFVDMFGPLDVERVIHHYGADKGWCTNIIPHAMCEASPGNRHVQAAIFSSKIDKIFNIVDYTLWAVTIASLGAGGALSAGAKAGQQTLRHAISTALRAPNSALRFFGKGVRPPLAAGLIGPSQPLGAGALAGSLKLAAKVAGDVTLKSTALQYKVLASALAKNSPNTLNSLFYNQGVGGTLAGTISRYLIINAGVGNDQLPVTLSPLIFKGAVLQAGLNGADVQYWSMGSKAHWAWRDFEDSIGSLFDTVFFGLTPDSSHIENTLRLLQDGNINND